MLVNYVLWVDVNLPYEAKCTITGLCYFLKLILAMAFSIEVNLSMQPLHMSVGVSIILAYRNPSLAINSPWKIFAQAICTEV